MQDLEQQQLVKNTIDIEVIKNTLEIIKSNHLQHLEKDMESVKNKVDQLDNKIDKVDSKIYYILLGVIGSVIVPGILKLLGVV